MADQEKPYWIGRNPTEQERLNRQHHIWTKCISYLIHPSILPSLPQNARIADIGTGTGIWLSSVAAASPSTYTLHGYDNSDAQFTSAEQLPSNVTLSLADYTKPFREELRGTYDMVHMRLLVVTINDGLEGWKAALKNILTLLKPGGWVMWVEGDFLGSSRGYRGGGAVIKPAPAVSGDEKKNDDADGKENDRGKLPVLPSSGKWLTASQNQMNSAFVRLFNFCVPDFTKLFTDAGLGDVEEDVVSTDRLIEQRVQFTEIGIGAVFSVLKNLAVAGKEGEDGWSLEEVERRRELVEKEKEDGAYFRWNIHVTIGQKKE